MNQPAHVPDDKEVYLAPAVPELAPRAVYFHVPFCVHRCGYCDFTLVAGREDLIPAWFASLENELSTQACAYPVDTIFVGGGTPSLLTPAQLERLGRLIHRCFQPVEGAEISFEANPDGLDADRLHVLKEIGVNRVSLGIQSFDDDVLKTLERQHSAAAATKTVERVSEFIENVSVDLIFGVPGQTLDSWQRTLDTAVRLPLRHISTYGLTFEKGTDFYRRRLHNQLTQISDDIERQMYLTAIEFLAKHELMQYEISSFAQSSFQCRHNHVYWDAAEYFGFGPGAARYVNGIRSTNARSVVRWIRSWQKNRPALQDKERLDQAARAREAVFLGLRRNAGIDLTVFERRFGCRISDLCGEALQLHLDLGNLQCVDGSLSLTASGRVIADSVVVDFL